MQSAAASFRSFAGTHVGRRRSNNEDAYLLDDEWGLWVVADGMGGQAAGEIASEQAVETVQEMVRAGLTAYRSPSESPGGGSAAPKSLARILESAVQAATYMVFGMAEQDRSKSGMGTTLSAMLATPTGALLAQVGDSRIYRIRNQVAEQLTEDHTLINWQIQQGLITEEEARTSKQKNVITRAVGNKDYVQVDILEIDVQKGDVFLLCSDGLHAYIKTEELPDLLQDTPQQTIGVLIDLANARGGKDNITVALVLAE